MPIEQVYYFTSSAHCRGLGYRSKARHGATSANPRRREPLDSPNIIVRTIIWTSQRTMGYLKSNISFATMLYKRRFTLILGILDQPWLFTLLKSLTPNNHQAFLFVGLTKGFHSWSSLIDR